MKQIPLLKKQKKAYGGELYKTRAGRALPRTLSTRATMHLVLRSSQANGEWSMRKAANASAIDRIVKKFASKYGVRVLSIANVGNHLHFHIRLTNRFGYQPFIRAITSAIAMAVTGRNRWSKQKEARSNGPMPKARLRFWDYRPFTSVVESFRYFLNLRDYVRINQLEGFGYTRGEARFYIFRDNELRRRYSRGS